jgi:TnpA family transposase
VVQLALRSVHRAQRNSNPPGTLRDSLVLLAVVLEQQTELKPTQIMTHTGAYSDVVFGLFRLLGYRFSPRLADIGGSRFWRPSPICVRVGI